MRTTLNIDDGLMRKLKIRAAQSDRTLTDLLESALRSYLASPAPKRSQRRSRRSKFPLIEQKPGASSIFAGRGRDEIHRQLAQLEAEMDLPES